MKKLVIISILINIVLMIILISMANTKISWVHNDKTYTHKLGDFYMERLRGE